MIHGFLYLLVLAAKLKSKTLFFCLRLINRSLRQLNAPEGVRAAATAHGPNRCEEADVFK
jgi:hypothetical protein